MHPFLSHLEDRLRVLKRKRPWLAEQIGKPVSTINSWFPNNSPPLLDTAFEVAKALGVSLDYLMTGNELEYTSDDPVLNEICKYIASLSHDEQVELMGMLKHMRYLRLMPDKQKKGSSKIA